MSDSNGALHAVEQSNAQKRLNREQFLQSRIVEKTVPINSMGGEIVIRSMSVKARKELRAKASPDGQYDDDLFTRLVIVHSLVDPQLEESDIEAIQEQNGQVFDEVVLAVTMLNTFGAGEDDLKDLEETMN